VSARASHPLPAPAEVRARRYQWLLFDADGTLFDFEHAELAALEQAFRQFGAPFQAAYLEVYREINRALWLELERGLIAPGRLKVRRFERLLAALGLAWSPAAFSDAYLQFLGAGTQLIEGAQELVQACHAAHHLAIVTNGLQAVQRSRLARSSIGPLFRHVIISEEIGVAKPDARFFDAAFALIGQPSRDQVLMIGDNWSSDIAGAAAYGLDTCWFNPRGEARPAAPQITKEIRALPELAAWLA